MRLSALILALAATATSAAPPIIAPAQVDAIFARWNHADTPGCAIRVDQGGATLIDRAYGSVDLEHPAPITRDTIFEAGSVSKQFTAAAIQLLIEDGKLALDDDVHLYIPELPDYGAPIRIANLLHHTSGLRDWGAVAELAGWPRGEATYDMRDVRAIVVRQHGLNFAPGSEYSYSNSGFNLLAMIVERVSGMSFTRFTAERLFVPLGMTSTSWRDDFRRVVPGRAIAYSPKGTYSPKDRGYEQTMPLEGSIGNGGLLTTVADLQRWNEALMANRIGRSVAVRMQERGLLTDGTRIAYATGLVVTHHGAVAEISHGGATGGYRTWLGTYPAQKLSVALLCSAAEANTGALAHAAVDLVLQPPAKPAAATASPAAAKWAGLWLDSHDQPLLLTARDGVLSGRFVGKLIPIGSGADGRYRTAGGDALSFAESGTLVVGSENGATRYRRETSAAENALAGFAGRYASSDVGAAYRIVAQDGAIRLALETRPQAGFTARAVGRDLFLDEAQNAVIRFHRDQGGAIDGFAITISRAFAVPFAKVG